MRQKIDIAEVETATKIRAKYLRALENDEFGLLPGSTFVKTFLRTYAEYLGLDATLLVEEYRVSYEPRGEAEPMQHFAPPRRRLPRRSRYATGPPGPGTAVVVLVITVLVIFAVLGLTSGGNKSNNTPQSAQQATKRKTPQKAAATPAPAKPKPKSVKMRVVPLTGPTYVCVDNSKGTKLFEGTIAKAQTFRGKHLRVNIGRTSVKLTVNGKRVKIPPGPASVAYDFTPNRRRAIPPGPDRPCT